MTERLSPDEVLQIDCNNPSIDYVMAGRFGGFENPLELTPLELTSPGNHLTADQNDNVPYACPLTRSSENSEREVQDFVTVCSDCAHSYVSLLPVSVEPI